MSEWLPPFAAAALLGVSVSNVHVIAHRRGWRRIGTGPHVRYATDDVLAEAERRAGRVSVAAGSVVRKTPATGANRPGA